MHERERWIYHPCVKTAVDAYHNGEPSSAEELRPGIAYAVAAIPDEADGFEYCQDCATATCPDHAPRLTAAGGNDAAPSRGQRGACYRCGMTGHFSRDCPAAGNGHRGSRGRVGGYGRGGGGRIPQQVLHHQQPAFSMGTSGYSVM